MYDQMITLIHEKETQDEYGNPKVDASGREIYAEELSIGMKEFYQADSDGFKPEIKFEIADRLDYQGENVILYNGIRYKVLRTYKPKNSNKLEITGYKGVKDVGSEVSSENQ